MNTLKLSIYLSTLFFFCFSYSQNDKETFKKMKKFSKNLKHYKYIPSGSFSITEEGDSIVSFRGFYMSQSEVSNFNWLEFVHDMQSRVDKDSLNKLLPDTTVWNKYQSNSSFEKYYFRHPAYRDYPVVGITYDQAKAFCAWLTMRLNSDGLSPFKRVIARLPLKSEWEYAAAGDLDNAFFPWGGPYLRNAQGQFLANFTPISQASIKEVKSDTLLITDGKNYSWLAAREDRTSFTAPCNSYFPNGYGLYNMAGNVSEFVETPGVLKGGSFNSTGYYLNIYHHEKYDDKNYRSAQTGFRILIQIVEY